MYDLRAIRQTYVETYHANGGNTTLAKLTALNAHEVAEDDRSEVASILSGSKNWEKPSEIARPHVRRRTPQRKAIFQGVDFKCRAAGDKD